MMKKFKNLETSKKILGGSWISAVLLTLTCVIGSFMGHDMSNVVDITRLAWGELTAAHCFYYWKAKSENRAKGVQKLVKDMAETYGTDAAARFAEIIYKD